MDGDLSVSFPKSTASAPGSSSSGSAATTTTAHKTPEEMDRCREREASLVDGHEDCGRPLQAGEKAGVDRADRAHDEEEEDDQFNRHVAWKFLLAGGVAGAGKPLSFPSALYRADSRHQSHARPRPRSTG